MPQAGYFAVSRRGGPKQREAVQRMRARASAGDAANAEHAAIGQGNIVVRHWICACSKNVRPCLRSFAARQEQCRKRAPPLFLSAARTAEKFWRRRLILAFEPEHIADYLAEDCEDNGCLLNRVLQAAYPPGSVFKLVVAAAALEDDICAPSQCFTCRKTAEVAGVTLYCSTGGENGHGRLNMREAMAVSCNCYFAQLGELVGVRKNTGNGARTGIRRNRSGRLSG